MSRFKTYGQSDEPPLQDGDGGFIGVDQYRQPHQLDPGYVAEARNARFVAGRVEPRLGVAKLAWVNGPASGQVPQPMGTVYGAGVYRDSDDLEWAIIAADGVIYRTREGAGLVEVPLPPGVVIDYDVTFVQTFNGLVMFRGASYAELYLTSLDSGFKPIVQETNTVPDGSGSPNVSGDGTEAIPPASNGEWIGNRLFIPYEDAATGQKDLVAISDYLNATVYASVRSQARINQGSSDRLLRVAKFNEFSAVCFKEKSIYALYNIQGDLTDMLLDEVSSEVGLAAPYAVVQVGRDADDAPSMLWFLSARRGISSLVFGEYGKLQLMAEPVSKPIQHVIDRIDWRNASVARAAWWNNRVYFAVPLDSSEMAVPCELPSATYTDISVGMYVVPGATYRWTKGANDVSCTNGSEVLTDTSAFTAQTYFVLLRGTLVGVDMTATVSRIYSPTNNAILVYDFLNKAWAGYDDGLPIGVKEFLKITLNGEHRLFYVGADGTLNLVEALQFDEVLSEDGAAWTPLLEVTKYYDSSGRCEVEVVAGRSYAYILGANGTGIVNGSQTLTATGGSFVAAGTLVTLLGTASEAVAAKMFLINYALEEHWVDFEVLTRGYSAGEASWKEFQGGALHLATWHPSYSAGAVLDGANEEHELVAAKTKDPTEYYKPFTAEPWDKTNTNDDHATAYREDYSVILDEAAVSSGLAAGTVYYLENLSGDCGVVYNSVYRVPASVFTAVAGQTTYTSLETSMVAQWLMEEATGDRTDSKGSNDLAPKGSPGRATGKVGYAVTLNTGQQLAVATNAAVETGDIDFTVAGWWYFTTLAGAARLLCGKGFAGYASNEYCIAATSAPQTIKFFVNNGASLGTVDSGVEPSLSAWYWVCAWHDAAANKIWIQINNNTPVSANHSAGVPVGAAPFVIGGDDWAQTFIGRVDAVMLWKRVLTAAERAALYNAGAGLEPGLGGTPAVYPPGGYVYMGENGIDWNLEQECVQPLEMDGRCRGRYLQLRFRNTQGRAALVATEVEAIRAQRRLATKA